jgi:hypothetical protein
MQPFVSMLRPRAHEFIPSEGRGRRRRTREKKCTPGKESEPKGMFI